MFSFHVTYAPTLWAGQNRIQITEHTDVGESPVGG